MYLGAELYLLGGRLGYPLDDSWIHLVFARSLARGQGLSFAPGELVAGSTAPLWTACLSLLFLLPGSVVAWTKVAGTAWHLVGVSGVYRLGRSVGLGRSLASIAAALVATTSWLVWSAVSGMEIPLFVALSVWGAAWHVEERRRQRAGGRAVPRSLLLFGLAVLARPEGLLLLALAVADRVVVGRVEDRELRLSWSTRSGLWVGVGSALLVFVPIALLFVAIGGSPLPTTFATKVSYHPPGLPGPGRLLGYLFTVSGIFFRPHPLPVLLAAGGALALARRVGSSEDRGLLVATWPVGLALAYAVLSANQTRPLVGNFGRYFFPLFPFVVVLGCLAVAGLERLPPRVRFGRLAVAWPLWLGCLAVVPTVSALFVGGAGSVDLYARNVLEVEESDVRMARALRDVLPPEAVLAVNDVGALGYHLPNPLLDLAGIVTPEVHDWARRAAAEEGDYRTGILAFLEDRRPDYLVVFPDWFEGILDRLDLVPLLRLEVPGNLTMGSRELVLYGTPWTRTPLGRPAADLPGARHR